MSYRIGDYKFPDRDGYLAAKSDMDLICSLKTEGSEREEIYASYRRQINEKGITFRSRIGSDFLEEIGDDTGSAHEGGARVYYVVSKRKRMVKLILMTSLSLLFALAALILIGWLYGDRMSRDSIKSLRETVNSAEDRPAKPAVGNAGTVSADAEGDVMVSETVSSEIREAVSEDQAVQNTVSPSADAARPVILPQFTELLKRNSDLAGWLTIPGTEIDYPVMYRVGDNDFYLNHDFECQNDVNGLLVLDKRCDPETDDPNWLIHGHNMRSGAMFGSLDNYTDESYYRSHPDVIFSTLYEKTEYRIFAVFRSTVYDEDTTDFQYYDYISIGSSEEFYDYVSGAKAQSLYETGISPEYGDGLITLSTCDYTRENGRLVIVGCTGREA